MSTLLLAALTLASPVAVPDSAMPYGSPAFKRLVATSCVASRQCTPEQFYAYWNKAMKDKVGMDAATWIAHAKTRLARSKDLPETRRALGEDAWKVIKKTITKFSLDRGFEFANVVRTGERQCHLQSTIIASLLQAAGMDAGLTMVWSNLKDEPSNLAHVAVLLRLAPDRAIVVDASEPEPFATHHGLFLYDANKGGYSFLRPRYNARQEIVGWNDANGRNPRSVGIAWPLSNAYVASQFDYYRGEREPGGILAKAKTPAGLARSERYFVASLKQAPMNPLSAYMLSRTYAAQGKTALAQKTLVRAAELYRKAGWTPDGVREALSSTR